MSDRRDALLARVLNLLDDVQWGCTAGGIAVCPECGNDRSNGHSNCALAELVAEITKELAPPAK